MKLLGYIPDEFVPYLGLLLAFGWIFWCGRKAKKFFDRVRQIHSFKPTKVREISAGYVALEGKLKNLGTFVKSPVSDTPSLFWKLQVTEEKKESNRTVFSLILNVHDFSPAAISDSSGSIEIKLGNATLRDMRYSHSELSQPTENFKRALERFGISDRGLIFRRNLSYSEFVLDENKEVTVLGKATQKTDGSWMISSDPSPKMRPMVISDRSRKGLIRQANLAAYSWVFTAILGPLSVAIPYVFFSELSGLAALAFYIFPFVCVVIAQITSFQEKVDDRKSRRVRGVQHPVESPEPNRVIQFSCPHCEQILDSDVESLGGEVKCPTCYGIFTVNVE